MAKGKRKLSAKGTSEPKKRDPERVDPGMSDPDEDSDSYFQDDVDKFHMNREKILLDSGAELRKDDASSGEDEVLAFDDDDDDDEDDDYQDMKKRLKQIRSQGHHKAMASDLEDESDDGEAEAKARAGKSEKAWGSSRSKFYGGHDSDLDEDLSGSEPEAAELEEQEALAVQKRLLMAMDEDDIGLDMLKQTSQTEEKPTEKITKDLSKMSKKEKLKLLKKQSPELLELIDDFKTRSAELQERLLPLVNLIRNKKLSLLSSGAKLVETKTSLCMNYLVNVSFYLMLKAKHSAVENHPVIKRLVQYRNLLKQIDSVEQRCKPEMDSFLQRVARGEEFETIEDVATETKFKSVLLQKKVSKGKSSDAGRKRLSEMIAGLGSEDKSTHKPQEAEAALEGASKQGRKRSRLDLPDSADINMETGDNLCANEDAADHEEGVEDEDADANRRGINWQISKNKGLTAKKRKEARNPRVKHKMKYKRAKVRRKGQVREARTEIDRYGGEISGIRAGIKRSIKLK